MLKLATSYTKSLAEEQSLTPEQLKNRHVGKQDPKRHLQDAVERAMGEQVAQSLGMGVLAEVSRLSVCCAEERDTDSWFAVVIWEVTLVGSRHCMQCKTMSLRIQHDERMQVYYVIQTIARPSIEYSMMDERKSTMPYRQSHDNATDLHGVPNNRYTCAVSHRHQALLGVRESFGTSLTWAL